MYSGQNTNSIPQITRKVTSHAVVLLTMTGQSQDSFRVPTHQIQYDLAQVMTPTCLVIPSSVVRASLVRVLLCQTCVYLINRPSVNQPASAHVW